MKVYMVGTLDLDALDEFRGMPIVVLSGSLDDVRAAGRLLYEDVTLSVAPQDASSPCASEGEPR